MKNKIKEFIYRRYNISFSKSGDDIQLMKLINESSPGVYVDVGCWHPIKASNSYYFSLRGWRGICIDPNPEFKKMYNKLRSRDTFVNCAIGDKKENLKYYLLNDSCSSMNTLDYAFIQKHRLESEIKEVIEVPLFKLSEVLEKNLRPNDRLDFFDVDVEGYDLEVLKTNDWEKYRPKIILVETDSEIFEDVNSKMTLYLDSVGYKLVGKSVINEDLGNLFFVDKKI
ncbi:FkbM family methyltransferase [Flavobacterium oreochromis]|uniref:Methyltransferase FkbM domain-containing protein n=2 Tax=Flavobacterium TaxID=237 RepID=A0A246GDY3_9FLAO|nr:FkbM family methyltransferase [Flavobacterium oreochromis]OWP77575.1 hypothetical protein BWG23_04350 [Flavobacterium oreochromis]OWP79613.1 hypothetical protein BWK62_01435 [Flavobacterium oreochromis]POR23350.1 hypothetical protein BWK58_10105 [Flavobacterium columnare]QYS86596.1 FkbM family methyltransferase [Flavobacterium oreochromis]